MGGGAEVALQRVRFRAEYRFTDYEQFKDNGVSTGLETDRHQVVVVTHLAQVAAFADRHYVVVKADDGQVTTSGVQLVADEQRTAELARMMAGLEATESALAHAGELVELAAATRRSD